MGEMKARAIYDFTSQNEDELSFCIGDYLTIVSQFVGAGFEGWWLARSQSTGRQGYIPENFVELLSPPEPAMPPPPPPPPPPPQQQKLQPPAYSPTGYQPPSQAASGGGGGFFVDEGWSSDEDGGGGGRGGGRTAAAARQQQPQPQQQQPPQQNQGLTLRKSASVTLSTASAEAAAAAATRADARKSIRALPKVPGIREFLLTDERVDIKDMEAIVITTDGLELTWQAAAAPFTCKVTEPSKTSKMRGLKSYIAYRISSTANADPNLTVNRRFKHFDWLHKQLADKFPCVAVPPLPDKQVTGRYEENFINMRMRQLDAWLNRMSAHPVVGPSLVFRHFVTCADEGKRWKEGKRRAEQDRLSKGQVYHAIRLSSGACDLTDMERFTDAFDGFATEMDAATKTALDTVLSHAKKCEANIKKEYARVADACFGFERAAALVPNNTLDSLTQAMKATGQSYQKVSELWGEQPRRDAEPLAEALHEYTGLLSCLPGVVSVSRGAVLTARECQRGLEDGRMTQGEAQEASQRSSLVCAAQCSEMNHFRQGVGRDYKAMMADYLREQVRFHQTIASTLQSALDSFSY